jgi:hypothetical protein
MSAYIAAVDKFMQSNTPLTPPTHPKRPNNTSAMVDPRPGPPEPGMQSPGPPEPGTQSPGPPELGTQSPGPPSEPSTAPVRPLTLPNPQSLTATSSLAPPRS